MTSYSQTEVEAIYHRASQIQAPDERAAYLAEACAGRDELLLRAKELLEAGDQLGSFMEQNAAAAVDLTIDQPVIERPGTMIGPYKLLEEIGEGGFGLVFVAQQDEPLCRRVALKVIKPGMDSREVISRFEAERQALALMDHPNIARVLDAGTTDSGRPYFVMELVRGVRITDYCDQAQLTPRERLDLFSDLCRAVQHAHQKGIIHRDIKPSNVLVTLHDGRPMVKIIDFGVAKALDRQLSEHSVYTRFHQMIGTPMYMSPEQTGLSSLDVDTRSDIYSLGALLYELLTGSTPFDRERLAHGALDEVQRIIREEEPHKPSTKLSDSGERLASIAAVRKTEPARLTKLVRGDLDWIVMKCLEKDRTRRYEAATGLVNDIQRYLHDEPVEASPPSATYRFRKFARKHRAAIAICAAFLAVLVTGAAIATWQAVRATQSEQLAQESAQRTERVLEFLISAFRKPDPSVEGRDVKVADVLEQAMKDAETNLVDDPLEKAAVLHAIGETLHALGIYDQGIKAHETAFEIRHSNLGDDHPDTLTSMNLLGNGYRKGGDVHKALPLLEQTLRLRRTQLGDDHPDTLGTMNNLAKTYGDAGELVKAMPLLEQALEIMRVKFGDDHPGTLISMVNLATTYGDAGELVKAMPLLEQALEIMRVKFGDDHPETLKTISHLGTGFYLAGKFEKAVPLLEEALELQRVKFGDDHPTTLDSMNNLGLVLLATDQRDKAVHLLEQALELTRIKLGEDHPDTLSSMHNLASAFKATGELDKALRLSERVLEQRRVKLGDNHPKTLLSMNNLAAMFNEAGESDKAVPLLEEALKLQRVELGEDHPWTLGCMNNLAWAFNATGELDKALRLYEQTLELARIKLGEDHPDTLSIMNSLASTYHSAGHLDKALRLHEKTLELSRVKLGADHPETVTQMHNLAYVFKATGELDKALPLFERALEHRRVKLGEDHPYTQSTMRGLAAVYMKSDRREEALDMLADNLLRERERLSDNDPKLANVLRKVAGVLLEGKQYADAEVHLRECLKISQEKQPDHWRLSQTNSMLGAALAGQGQFDEAEPLLLEGYDGMKAKAQNVVRPLPKDREAAAKRLIDFYTQTNQPEEVAKWQTELARIEAEIEQLRQAVSAASVETGDGDNEP